MNRYELRGHFKRNIGFENTKKRGGGKSRSRPSGPNSLIMFKFCFQTRLFFEKLRTAIWAQAEPIVFGIRDKHTCMLGIYGMEHT